MTEGSVLRNLPPTKKNSRRKAGWLMLPDWSRRGASVRRCTGTGTGGGARCQTMPQMTPLSPGTTDCQAVFSTELRLLPVLLTLKA